MNSERVWVQNDLNWLKKSVKQGLNTNFWAFLDDDVSIFDIIWYTGQGKWIFFDIPS